MKCVFSGAGAAAMACANLFISVGVKKENLTYVIAEVIYEGRTEGMSPIRNDSRITRHTEPSRTPWSRGCLRRSERQGRGDPRDVEGHGPATDRDGYGESRPQDHYPDAMAARDDVIMATGRSDYPNQVNNVLGFLIFRALDARATTINEEMKLAAVYALAELARGGP